MNLTLVRYEFGDKYTIGRLYVNGMFECYTLEDRVRPKGELKVFGQTAIPEGTIRVILNMSPRFKRIMPRLLDVPGFDGILIHTGNTPEDTHGCILVGDKVKDGQIVRGESTPAYWKLFGKLNKATDITIEVQHGEVVQEPVRPD